MLPYQTPKQVHLLTTTTTTTTKQSPKVLLGPFILPVQARAAGLSALGPDGHSRILLLVGMTCREQRKICMHVATTLPRWTPGKKPFSPAGKSMGECPGVGSLRASQMPISAWGAGHTQGMPWAGRGPEEPSIMVWGSHEEASNQEPLDVQA